MACDGLELDEVTLAAARRGDLRACETIYRQFRTPCIHVAARVLGCRDAAQDVVQDAFVTAFRRIRQFRGDAPFWGWLRRVVVNHAISSIRKRGVADVLGWDEQDVAVDGDQSSLSHAMDLEEALACLDDEDRAVVWLHDVEGYRHQEIAEMFGKTESYSKTRLSRARARLRDLIADHDPATAGAVG